MNNRYQHQFSGIFTALITPFTKTNAIDYQAIEKILKKQIESGIHGIVICGSTGESFSLSLEEYKNIITHCKNYVEGQIQIIANIAGINQEEILAKNQFCNNMKLDGTLLATMPYIKPQEKGMQELYHNINGSSDIPMIIYNVPSRTGVDMSNNLMIDLCKEKNIVAIKEASGNISRLLELSSVSNQNIALLTGEDANLVPFCVAGGNGAISVLSNAFPKELIDIYNLCKNSKYDEAFSLHSKFATIINLLFCQSNPIPIKYIMHKLDFIQNFLRLPLSQLSGSLCKQIDIELNKI